MGKVFGGGGGGSSNGTQTQKWDPNAWQKTVLGDANDPTSQPNTVLGNLMGDNGYLAASNLLRNQAVSQLNNYFNSDLANFDYSKANDTAQGYIGVGQNNLQDLANGNLSSGIMKNISDSLQPEYQRNVGGMIAGYGNRGVLGSSLTQAAMYDANKAYADSFNQQAQNWMGTLGNANNSLINNSIAGVKAAETAQDAAMAGLLSALNAGIGSFNTANSVLGQTQGTTSVSNKQGSMHGQDYLNMGLQIAGMFL